MPPGAFPWPVPFAAALAVLRTSLRQVAPGVIRSPTAQSVVQPLANTIGWPSVVLPSNVTVLPDALGRERVPGEWLLPNGRKEAPRNGDRVLLWAHGGAFSLLSPGTHRRFLAKIATRADVPVYSVNYRKPPAFPFPVPGNDVLDAYQALHEHGCADRVFLGGDSAGGNLALLVARTLARLEEPVAPPPEGLVLLSPWVDLSDVSSESWRAAAEVDFICQPQAETLARLYAPGLALDDERLSPGLCRGWRGRCPPVLLDYGGGEAFRAQIERLAAAMAEDGVDLDVAVAEGMVHVYPCLDFLWGPSPGPFESYFARVAKFLRR